MKYAKLLKNLSGSNSSLLNSKSKETAPSSIYVENPLDPKIGIPANTFAFDYIIHDAFNIDDSSSDEEPSNEGVLTEKEWLKKCLESYEDKNPFK